MLKEKKKTMRSSSLKVPDQNRGSGSPTYLANIEACKYMALSSNFSSS